MKLHYLFAAMLIAAPVTLIAEPIGSTPSTPTIPSSTSATRVAVANAGKILAGMKERQALEDQGKQELDMLKKMGKEKEDELNQIKKELDLLSSTSNTYQDKTKQLMEKAIQYEAWVKISQADLQRRQKLQMRGLFDKIEKAVAEVAKSRNFDLVISDQRSDLPAEKNIDQVNVDQLRAMITQRIILYSTNAVDITQDVITLLDQQFTKGIH